MNKPTQGGIENYAPRGVIAKWARRYKSILVGSIITAIIFLIAIFAPLVADDPNQINIAHRFSPPSVEHPIGTDHFGRDIWSRMVFGSRVSLKVSTISVFIALLVGTIAGMISGFIGGVIDNILMRLFDALLSFPTIALALLLRLVIGPNTSSLIVTIAFIYTPIFARTARGIALVEREKLYIEAARALGASNTRIILIHVTPNMLAPLTVLATTFFANAILVESSLSFLGVGTSIFEPSWGAILSDSKPYLQEYAYLAFYPGLIISLAILGINLLGEGLRNLLKGR